MRGQEFKVSYRLQQWFRNERFFNTMTWFIAKNKTLARTFAYVFNDVNLKNSYRVLCGGGRLSKIKDSC